VNNYIHTNLPTQPNVKNNEKPKKPFAISEVEEYDETAELLKLFPESDFMKQFENLSLSLNASYDQYEPNIDDCKLELIFFLNPSKLINFFYFLQYLIWISFIFQLLTHQEILKFTIQSKT
jgi:hypothetical protein